MDRALLREESDGYIPFRARFLAWWNGVEPDALVRSSDVDRTASPGAIQIDPEAALAAEAQAVRQSLLQELWGEGALEPGGTDYTVQLVKPAAPIPEHNILDLAPGLCGGAKAVSEEYGVWVDAMEPDPDLLDAAKEFCRRKAMLKKIRLSGCNPDALAIPKKRYDSIYSRERFYLFEDKQALLAAIRDGLKPGGQLLFTDLVLADRKRESEAVAQWRDVLPARPFFWTLQEYQEALRALKFDIRVFEDETDSLCGNILRGWSDFAAGLEDRALGRTFVDVLMTEAERWLYQVKAMESGQVRFLRVHAIHYRNKMRLMSDP